VKSVYSVFKKSWAARTTAVNSASSTSLGMC
jgi:hypothetical protein